MRAWQGGGAVQGEAGGRQGATGVCRDLSRSELWEGGAAVEGVLDPGPWLPHLFSTGSSSTQNERCTSQGTVCLQTIRRVQHTWVLVVLAWLQVFSYKIVGIGEVNGEYNILDMCPF